jgi:hypothetical protein
VSDGQTLLFFCACPVGRDGTHRHQGSVKDGVAAIEKIFVTFKL